MKQDTRAMLAAVSEIIQAAKQGIEAKAEIVELRAEVEHWKKTAQQVGSQVNVECLYGRDAYEMRVMVARSLVGSARDPRLIAEATAKDVYDQLCAAFVRCQR